MPLLDHISNEELVELLHQTAGSMNRLPVDPDPSAFLMMSVVPKCSVTQPLCQRVPLRSRCAKVLRILPQLGSFQTMRFASQRRSRTHATTYAANETHVLERTKGNHSVFLSLLMYAHDASMLVQSCQEQVLVPAANNVGLPNRELARIIRQAASRLDHEGLLAPPMSDTPALLTTCICAAAMATVNRNVFTYHRSKFNQ